MYYKCNIDQKAWRKRQLCYKLIRKSQASYAITDIILLSRSKRAPDGFNLVGYETLKLNPLNIGFKILSYRDLNGLSLCYKTSSQSPVNVPSPLLSYGYVNKFNHYIYHTYYILINYYRLAPSLPTDNNLNSNGSLSSHPSLDLSANSLSHDYDRLMSLKPTRPAPKLPQTYSSSNYSTLNSYQGIIFNVIKRKTNLKTIFFYKLWKAFHLY